MLAWWPACHDDPDHADDALHAGLCRHRGRLVRHYRLERAAPFRRRLDPARVRQPGPRPQDHRCGRPHGSGFGCSFAGSLSPTTVAGIFGGTITASGCTESAFNGSYAEAKAKRDDGSRSSPEREAQSAGVTTKARIAGKWRAGRDDADHAHDADHAVHAGHAPGITGSFTGAFSASIETRTRTNGNETRATTSVSGNVSLAVASGGTLTGTRGFGCSFAGTLTLADAATQRYTGTAHGIWLRQRDAQRFVRRFGPSGKRRPAPGRDQRESETSTVRTKVRIEGTASRA